MDTDTKNWLELIVIPVALALLPLIWGLTGWWIKRLQFQSLIFREIEEIGPYPSQRNQAENRGHWSEHHTSKKFVHTDIFDKPTDNRDFILSLPADIVYYVNQLWGSKGNSRQWIYMLFKLEKKIPPWQNHHRKRIAKVRRSWYVLMKEYGEQFDPDFEKECCPKYPDLSESERCRLQAIARN